MRWTTRTMFAIAIVVAGTVLLAPDALAQICTGNPTVANQLAIGTRVGFSERSRGYGLDLLANPAGPIGLGAGYTRFRARDGESRGYSFRGGINYELPISTLSLCPAVMTSYGSTTADPASQVLSNRSYAADFGFGVGMVLLESNRLRLAPFVIPSYTISRVTFAPTEPVSAGTFSQFQTEIGLLLNLSRFFGTGTTYLTRNAGPSFGIGAGVGF